MIPPIFFNVTIATQLFSFALTREVMIARLKETEIEMEMPWKEMPSDIPSLVDLVGETWSNTSLVELL